MGECGNNYPNESNRENVCICIGIQKIDIGSSFKKSEAYRYIGYGKNTGNNACKDSELGRNFLEKIEFPEFLERSWDYEREKQCEQSHAADFKPGGIEAVFDVFHKIAHF